MSDMRGNLAAIIVFLVLGITVLRLVGSATKPLKPRWRLVSVAFVCGPGIALVFFFMDIFWLSPHDYLVPGDYVESLVPTVIVGIIGGTIGSAAIWMGEYLSCSLGKKHGSTVKNRADKKSHAQSATGIGSKNNDVSE